MESVSNAGGPNPLLVPFLDVVSGLGDLTVGVLVLGLLTMIALQVVKMILPLRRWYQRRRLDAWIDRGESDFDGFAVHLRTAAEPEKTRQLVEKYLGDGVATDVSDELARHLGKLHEKLQAAGHRWHFAEGYREEVAQLLRLSPSELTGQLERVSQIVMENPDKDLAAFLSLTRGTDHDSRLLVIAARLLEREMPKEFHEALVVAQTFMTLQHDKTKGERRVDAPFVAALSRAQERINDRLTANLDNIQLELRRNFPEWQRSYAFALSLALVLAAGVGGAAAPATPEEWIVVLPLTLLGGYVAGLFHDLLQLALQWKKEG